MLDVFPARVMIQRAGQPNQVITKARVREVGGAIEVWVENSIYPHEPIIAYTSLIHDVIDNTLTTSLPVRKQHVTLHIDDGVMGIQRESGCGCGSRLRAIPHMHKASAIQEAIRSNWPETAEV